MSYQDTVNAKKIVFMHIMIKVLKNETKIK